MNVPLEYLWIIVIILLIAFVIYSVIGISNWTNAEVVVIPPTNLACAVAFDQLPSVTGTPCCYVGGSLTESRYMSTLDLVVNPVPSGYLSICQQFCTNGVTSSGINCVAGTAGSGGGSSDGGQAKLQACIAKTQPVNCASPAMPVAALGNTYFYPHAATDVTCQDRRPC